jgi:hypothetical protein
MAAYMRASTFVALASLFFFGCAHFTSPPPTEMVEVTDGSIPVGPPAATHREEPGSKRRALLIGGGLLMGVGVVLTAVGVGLYLHEQQQQQAEEAACAHSDQWFCGLGDAFDTVPGAAVIGVGVPALASGLVLTFVGFGHHD